MAVTADDKVAPDWMRYIKRENRSAVLYTTEDCGRFRATILDSQAADLFLETVSAYGSVPWGFLNRDIDDFKPKETVKIHYCVVVPIQHPAFQTWDSELQAPRL